MNGQSSKTDLVEETQLRRILQRLTKEKEHVNNYTSDIKGRLNTLYLLESPNNPKKESVNSKDLIGEIHSCIDDIVEYNTRLVDINSHLSLI